MDDKDLLAKHFEEHRSHLRSVAYRMLGSLNEADDAVQEAWFRLARADAAEIGNLGGWLTTTVGRICLDLLRSRKARREEFGDTHVPDPVVSDGADPEREIMMADSVGIALMVVLETLGPAERLA
ncbi:sigma factor, partial [Actinomadura kijaniata]|uniref:sigma factor n=1 Tax=Actinomadura kijaniata TaxID=46161 RepID=UPI003F193202